YERAPRAPPARILISPRGTTAHAGGDGLPRKRVDGVRRAVDARRSRNPCRGRGAVADRSAGAGGQGARLGPRRGAALPRGRPSVGAAPEESEERSRRVPECVPARAAV